MRGRGRQRGTGWRRLLLVVLGGVPVAVLAGCAGPGGEGLATAAAMATARHTVPTVVIATIGGGPDAAITGSVPSPAMAASPIAAASSASAVSPAPATSGSPTVTRAVAVVTGTPGTPVTLSGSATANIAPRTVTVGSATMGAATGTTTRVAGTATTGTAVGTRTGSAVATIPAAAQIPAPPEAIPYMPGQSPILDVLVQAVNDTTKQHTTGIAVTDYRTHRSTAMSADVLAFYREEMTRRGWAEEQADTTRQGFTSLLFSRDNRTTGGLIFIVDAAQVGQRGTLVITTLAKPM